MSFFARLIESIMFREARNVRKTLQRICGVLIEPFVEIEEHNAERLQCVRSYKIKKSLF